MADFVRRSGRKTTKLTDLSESGSGPNSPGMEVYHKQKTKNDAQAYLGPISGREEESEEEAEGAEKPACQGGWEQQIPLRLQPIKWQKSKIPGKIPTSLQIGVFNHKKKSGDRKVQCSPYLCSQES